MKNYLRNFMIKCEYDSQDIDYLLCAFNKVENNLVAKGHFEKCLSLYKQNYKVDFSKEVFPLFDLIFKQLDLPYYTIPLLVFMAMTKQTKAFYEEQGISEQIYWDSMLDLKYKMEKCKVIKGIVGLFTNWFIYFLRLEIFGLGRLQFRVIKFGKTYNKDGITLLPDDLVIDVHIPEMKAPFDKASRDDAYDKAFEFFKDKVNKKVYVCDSWLLGPINKQLLNPKSNIYSFMSEFDIISSGVYRENEDLWRIFDTNEQNPDKLPADTSLRRAIINHLKSGGRLEYGFGVLIR